MASPNHPVVLVTGATGHQGSAVARHLLSAGAQVHALVRDPSSQAAVALNALGARLFAGDFDNIPSLKAAAEGATVVFINVSPVHGDTSRDVLHAKNVIEAARASGTVKTLVLSSVLMATKHETFPGWGPDYPMAWYWESKAQIEDVVRSAKFETWTIIRPSFLMKNTLPPTANFFFPELFQKHTLLSAFDPTTAITLLDEEDVGKLGAAVILEPAAFNGHVIDLGTESLTIAEIAREMGVASGKDITLQFHSPEESERLAVDNVVVQSQRWGNDVGFPVDFKKLEQYPVELTKFATYLEKHKDEVKKAFS
ncbi:hypothetical protein FQN52_001606 [Onygenales sp. PD_12]|nr:hypothetical protein FQN52_001606 [Onygenales sp. PD_12]